MSMVDTMEKGTVNQASSSSWFQYREGRLTAQIKMTCPKTEKGFMFAADFVEGTPKRKVIQIKLSHGKFYEPVALQI